MRLPRVVSRALLPFAGRLPVPILSGENRGRLWSVASAGSGYATGLRSSEQMRVFASLVRPGDRVWDVGAHHGYMTLCASQRAGASGRIFAFEPSVENRALLNRHLAWNGVENAQVSPLALSDFEGQTTFGGDGTSKMLALGGGDEVVSVTRGASLIQAGACEAPTVMKIDVEGAEGGVLRGMGKTIPTQARILAAIHSYAAFVECCAALRGLGFRLLTSVGLQDCLSSGRWNGDPDLLALGPNCSLDELDSCVVSYVVVE